MEVAHEAVLREWERLRNWLNESRDEIRLQRQLARMTGGEAWHWAALAVLVFLVIETACVFLFGISKRRSGSKSAGGRA